MRRLILRHGGYTFFAIASLALAVGPTLAVFTFVNALWLRPIPFPDADRLVTVMGETNSGSTEALWFAGLEGGTGWSSFEAVAGQVVTTGGLAGLQPRIVFAQVGHELETLAVTSQYFRLFGQHIRGRDFAPDDNRYAAEPVAIISDRLWSRAFRRRADVIGAVATAAPFPIRIVGVAPPGFEGAQRGEHADVWIPSNLAPRVSAATDSGLPEDAAPGMVFGRLHPGQTTSDAERRLVQDALNERDRRVKERARVVPLKDVFGTPDSRTIVIREQRAATVVGILASLVMLAGCATIMALVLVHYERRRRELSVRIALGASRARLARHLVGELAWIAASGMVGAVLLAMASLRAIPAFTLPGGVDLSRLDLSIDWRVLVAALATTVVTLVLAALVPIIRFTRSNLGGELTAAGSSLPASSQRVRQALLGLHVAATCVVLIAAGLFVRAVVYGFSAGPGFEIDRTAYVQVQVVPPFGGSPTAEDRTAVIAARTRQLQEGFRALPGVNEVAMGLSPIGPQQASFVLAPKTIETRSERRDMRVGVMSGSPELLAALGVRILKGRPLMAADATANPKPAVMTASLARVLWPNEEPLGQIVSLGFRQCICTVVGIVPDFVYGTLTESLAGVVVTVRGVSGGMEPAFVIRSDRPDLLVEPIRKLVKDIVPDAPRLVVSTGQEIVARDLGRQRLGAWFLSGFGLIALVLGAGGVFGLVAYLAQSRRREFGVRLALGATPRDLVWQGLAAGLKPVCVGAAIGSMVSATVTGVLISLLPGLSALDPLTYVSVAALILSCATVAGLAAAWRLRGIAPADALRTD